MESNLHDTPLVGHLPGVAETERSAVVYHGTNLARAGSILFTLHLRSTVSLVYADSTVGFVYVTTAFRDAVEYAQNAVVVEANRSTRLPFGSLCVVFRLKVSPADLLPDSDEARVDKAVREETGLLSNRATNSRRIAHDLFVGDQEIALLNPMHPRFGLATSDDVVWHPIPSWFSSKNPLSY